MLKHKIAAALVTAGLALSIGSNVGSAQDDDFSWSGSIEQGDEIEIRTVVGDIEVFPANGSEVTVTAVKDGRRRDFDDVEIEISEHSGGVTICVVYLGGRRSRRDRDRGRGRDCNGRGNRHGGDDIDVSVDFEVRVPTGVNFRGGTVVGDVRVDDIEGDVIASSVTGHIDVEASGLVEATTVSGDIDVSMGRVDWSGELDFHTVSGDITLELPSGLDTDVNFESVSGDFESDFPITVRRRGGFLAGHLRGTIGAGGRELSVQTVSGNVTLIESNR